MSKIKFFFYVHQYAVKNNLHKKFSFTVIIDHACRSQGLGSLLLQAVEDYLYKYGIRHVYLITKGQEKFYLKNGYVTCEPVKQLPNFTNYNTPQAMTESKLNLEFKKMNIGPPPPPMPNNLKPPLQHISFTLSTHTSMKKTLESLY